MRFEGGGGGRQLTVGLEAILKGRYREVRLFSNVEAVTSIESMYARDNLRV